MTPPLIIDDHPQHLGIGDRLPLGGGVPSLELERTIWPWGLDLCDLPIGTPEPCPYDAVVVEILPVGPGMQAEPGIGQAIRHPAGLPFAHRVATHVLDFPPCPTRLLNQGREGNPNRNRHAIQVSASYTGLAV